MSHFTVGVILPKHFDPQEAETINGYIAAQMAPFDENKEVPEYLRECGCKGSMARNRVYKLADKLVGKAAPYWKNPERWIERDEVVQGYLPYQPDQFSFDPNCEDCNGTGKTPSHYNPLSKWDWYRVGGRWDGYITHHEQSSEGGFNWDKRHETIENNIARLGDLLKAPELPTFWAMITPDGEWLQKGEMGWWGMASNEKDPDSWEALLCSIYATYQDRYVVLLDVHI